jgi:hypothetical protein
VERTHHELPEESLEAVGESTGENKG